MRWRNVSGLVNTLSLLVFIVCITVVLHAAFVSHELSRHKVDAASKRKNLPHDRVKEMHTKAQRGKRAEGKCGRFHVPLVAPYEGFIEDIFSALEGNASFGWVRFGDGEILCVTAAQRAILSGADCNEDTKLAVTKAFQDLPDESRVFAVLGSWWLCDNDKHTGWDKGFATWLQQQTSYRDRRFAFIDQFYIPLGEGPGHPGLIRSLQGRDVVLVAPRALNVLLNTTMFRMIGHILVPAHHGFVGHVPSILQQCTALASRYRSIVFLVAFGIPGKVLIINGMRLLPQHTFIDVGSSLDAFAGIRSRDYNMDLERYCKTWKTWMAPGVCK